MKQKRAIVNINTEEEDTMLGKHIAEKASNLVLQNFDQIEKDWKESRLQAEEPEKVKFPVNIKVVLSSLDGIKKDAKIAIEWAVIAKRSVETTIEEDNTPDLPMDQ